MFKKTLATVALAVMATFAFAPAANAAGYVPDDLVTQEEAPVAGETTVIAFAEGAFAGNEFVDFTVTGSHEATLSVIKTAVDSTLRKQASGGAVSVNIVLHPDAFGTYTLTGVGADSGLIGIASATIVPADAGAATGDSASGLSATGYNVPVLVIWGAGGLLALGVALVLVRLSIRRQQLAK
ncbi:sortase [Cryobacterium glaciale]|uniref:Sortase n=1 Tax=Cryobacterium glaciale TaxID=1259145 RepID=A0A4R8UTN8_9MICO|nr:sortase [Cryobacterium glaciale]TFB71824.1 sortase [Cryobacterium glaciale]